MGVCASSPAGVDTPKEEAANSAAPQTTTPPKPQKQPEDKQEPPPPPQQQPPEPPPPAEERQVEVDQERQAEQKREADDNAPPSEMPFIPAHDSTEDVAVAQLRALGAWLESSEQNAHVLVKHPDFETVLMDTTSYDLDVASEVMTFMQKYKDMLLEAAKQKLAQEQEAAKIAEEAKLQVKTPFIPEDATEQDKDIAARLLQGLNMDPARPIEVGLVDNRHQKWGVPKVENEQITDEVIRVLSASAPADLTHLRLRHSHVTEVGLKHLEHMSAHLVKLSLDRALVPPTQQAILNLQSLSHLQLLRLDAELPEASLGDLSRLPALEELDLNQVQDLVDEHLKPLAAVTQLKTLRARSYNNSFGPTELAGTFLEDFKSLRQLTELDFTGAAGLSRSSLAHLRNIPTLQVLNLSHTVFVQQEEEKGKQPGQRHRFRDEEIEYLSSLSNLRELHVVGCEALSIHGVVRLLDDCPALEKIRWFRCDIKVTKRSAQGPVQELDLSHAAEDEKKAHDVKSTSMAALRWLCKQHLPGGDAGASALVDNLSHYMQLVGLSHFDCCVSPVCAVAALCCDGLTHDDDMLVFVNSLLCAVRNHEQLEMFPLWEAAREADVDCLALSRATLLDGDRLSLFNSYTQKPQHVLKARMLVSASLLQQEGPISALGGLPAEDLLSFLRFKAYGLGAPVVVAGNLDAKQVGTEQKSHQPQNTAPTQASDEDGDIAVCCYTYSYDTFRDNHGFFPDKRIQPFIPPGRTWIRAPHKWPHKDRKEKCDAATDVYIFVNKRYLNSFFYIEQFEAILKMERYLKGNRLKVFVEKETLEDKKTAYEPGGIKTNQMTSSDTAASYLTRVLAHCNFSVVDNFDDADAAAKARLAVSPKARSAERTHSIISYRSNYENQMKTHLPKERLEDGSVFFGSEINQGDNWAARWFTEALQAEEAYIFMTAGFFHSPACVAEFMHLTDPETRQRGLKKVLIFVSDVVVDQLEQEASGSALDFSRLVDVRCTLIKQEDGTIVQTEFAFPCERAQASASASHSALQRAVAECKPLQRVQTTE